MAPGVPTFSYGLRGIAAMEVVLKGPAMDLHSGLYGGAIANPATAPYGAAGVEVMKALGVYDQLAPKIVQGGNINQTFQFVDTGNAEVGFVALSQVIELSGGSRWLVDASLYSPIKQDAVLLKTGAGNAAARAFLDFLKGPEALKVIEKFGYATK